ncbi:hypothetical protein [Microbacterium sp. NPDC089696]|uniref:hypothetical protein n=1 Tax=Microbacterium sp. NPDC089696 TaxID=3364199 RepID=UPI00382789D0
MLARDTAEQIETMVRRVVREELDVLRLEGTHPLVLSLSFRDAAKVTGYSVDSIQKAVKRLELMPSYANTKPVIMVEELIRWLRERPIDVTEL